MLDKRRWKKDKLKNGIVIGIFSVFFGIVFSIAHQLICTNQLKVNIKEISLAGGILFVILMSLWELIQKVDMGQSQTIQSFNKKEKWIIGLISICLNVLCFLTYFPGVGMNDGLNIMNRGMAMTQQFPVMYCIVIVFFTKIGSALGSLQYSVIIYSVLQLICVSAIYTWIVIWFSKKCAPKYLKYLVMIYFFVEPLLAMYSISMLKDTLFSLLLFVFVLIVYDLVIEKEKITRVLYWVFFVIVLGGILSLRNNGSYVVFPMLFILFICCKENRKGIMFVIVILVTIFLLEKILMIYFGAEQLFQEIVGIPLQQMAAVVANNGSMTVEQTNFLNKLMPLEEMAIKYNPGTVDTIKWDVAFDREFLNEHKVDFLITWLGMLPNNFLIYVKAYLQETFWFWAPYQNGIVQCFYSIENENLVQFLVTNGIHDQPLLPETLNSILRTWYGLGSRFFREGVCFWIMLSSLVLAILKNKTWRMIIVYAPILLLWLTIMITTPISFSFRYVLVFAYALPFFVGILFVKSKK